VKDRPPGDDAAELAIGEIQGGHRAHLEPKIRVRPSGDLHHLRRQIDTERGDTERVQVRGDVARATPEIGDRLAAVGLYVLGERGQHRASQQLLREQRFHEFGVVVRDGVVGLPGGGQVGRLNHTARR
jgi:hypothetical protein